MNDVILNAFGVAMARLDLRSDGKPTFPVLGIAPEHDFPPEHVTFRRVLALLFGCKLTSLLLALTR